ncbi:LOW QUALITY PROTEIN: CD180 antigen [Sylvia borin]
MTKGKPMLLQSSKLARRIQESTSQSASPPPLEPVSLTSIPGKLMEQNILEVITTHVEEKEVIRSSQQEFHKGKSGLTTLTAFCDGQAGGTDEGRAVVVVCLHFSKALDTISHNILIGKHRKHGLDEWTVRWTKDWLNGRAQRITENRSYSWEGLGLREVPVTPITTKILHFSFNVLLSLQNSAFSDLNSLLYLDFTRCQISWVHDCAFHSNRQLETLLLTRNQLMFLSDTAFAGPCSLEHLNTDRNNMFFIPVTNLDSLGILNLGSYHISSLQFPLNFPIGNLKCLNFSMNSMQAITAGDVQALQKTSTVTLILTGNDITYTEPGSFQSHFYSLSLVGDGIPAALVRIQNSTAQALWLGRFYSVERSRISPDISQGLCCISVKDLYLQVWHFRNLNADTFQCLTRKLDLTQTHIHALSPGISGRSLLEEMVLNVNCFEHLNTSSAAVPSLSLHSKGNSQVLQPGSGCLEKLAKLLSSHTENSDCCRKALRALSRLHYLNLSHNTHLHLQDMLLHCASSELLDLPFTPLPINTSQSPFQNLHLQLLNLSLSHINTSIRHFFQGLKNLMFLDLSQNNFELGIMPKDKLFQLSNLEALILPSCELTAIGNQVFHNIRKLQHVHLRYNKCTAFSTDAFPNLKSAYLSCAHNSTHVVPGDQLMPLVGCCIINLSYNLLDCIYSKIYLITWYKHKDKIEDPEGTGSESKLLAVQLATISLSCGKDTSGIIAVVLAVLSCSAVFIWGAHCFKQNYQQLQVQDGDRENIYSNCIKLEDISLVL